MRDPKRIDEVLQVIERVWKQNPDLRFMQLILNVSEFYYMEDDDFLRNFKSFYNVD